MPWFPHFATRAYVETLELRRDVLEQQRPSRSGRPRIVEPSSAEFLAALAAGTNAQHIVQVGCGLSTVALAAAAKATGCCLISLDTDGENQKIVGRSLQLCGLTDYVQFFRGDPCDIVTRRQDVDFVLIGGPTDIYIELFDLLNLKPGAVVVADYALDESTNEYIKHVRRQPGVDSSTLPVGRGLEITKMLKWDDFKNGRTRYDGRSSLGPSRLLDYEDSHSAKHSDTLSESGGSWNSHPTSVSSVFAAEAWMASKAATFLSGRGPTEETYDVETYPYAAQELALSVNSSVSSVHAAEAWMAAQAAKAYYKNSRDDDDEYYELEPEKHEAGEMPDLVNGEFSDSYEDHANYDDSHVYPAQRYHHYECNNHGGEEVAAPRNGFVLSREDHKSDKLDAAVDESHQAEGHDGQSSRYVLQESLLLPNRISCHNRVEADRTTKGKSTFPSPSMVAGVLQSATLEDSQPSTFALPPSLVTGESQSARLKESQPSAGVTEQQVHSESADKGVCMEPHQKPTKRLQGPGELCRQSEGHSDLVGDIVRHEILTELLPSADASEPREQDPKFEITFHDEDGQTAVLIQGVDQDMLLFDITMAFNESGVSVRRAKINTTMEKHIEDTFYVVDSKTGAALDVSSWGAIKGNLLSKLIKH